MGKTGIIYIGSYTQENKNGIHVLKFDYDTKKLEIIDKYVVINSSYLALSSNNKYLYAVNELDQMENEHGGGAKSFEILEDGKLKYINSAFTKGKAPCHISADKNNEILFVANYNEGTVSIFKLSPTGEILEMLNEIRVQGSSVNKIRQEKAHAHFIIEFYNDGEKRRIAFCDLGSDKINIYESSDNYKTVNLFQEIKSEAGSGPRHLEFDNKNNIFYVLNELSNDIDVFKNKENNYFLEQKNPTIKSNEKESTSAAIHFSRCRNFIVSSNRGDDSLAIFKIEKDKKLSLVDTFKTFGRNPRDFSFDETGQFIFVANQDSNLITVFSFDSQSGKIEKLNSEIEISKPVCIKIGMGQNYTKEV